MCSITISKGFLSGPGVESRSTVMYSIHYTTLPNRLSNVRATAQNIQENTATSLRHFYLDTRKSAIYQKLCQEFFMYYIALTPWLMEPGGSMPHSLGLSNNPYPEPNQPNYPH